MITAKRRHKAQKKIDKRLNIVRNVWKKGLSLFSGKGWEPTIEEEKPNILNKWNFTCNCGMCKIESVHKKLKNRRERYKFKNLLKQNYENIDRRRV